jgi:type II secretory pathway pseudopilin PulG
MRERVELVLSISVRSRREAPPEGGFTIIEVMIATSILMIVLGMFFATLESLTKSEDRSQRLVSNEQNVRFELDQLAREVRASNPLVALPTTNVADYESQIEFVLGPTGGVQQVVRWTYNTVTETVARQIMSDTSTTATVVSQSFLLTHVRNVETATPLFTYYDAQGVDLVAKTLAGNGVASYPPSCAIRVHMILTSDSNPGPVPFTETQDVELRNRLPGIFSCGG